MAGKTYVEGGEEIEKALADLGNMGLADWKVTLRSAVREPMKDVAKKAKANISAFSPGKAEVHRTYLGNWVGAGFASRSILLRVKLTKQGAVAVLGVAKEAFYAISFFEIGAPSAGIPAQPWLVPALESSKEEMIRKCGAAMRSRIENIWRRRALKAARAAKGTK